MKKPDGPPAPPAREVGRWLDLSGLRKAETLPGDRPGEAPAPLPPRPPPRRARRAPAPPYVELRAASAFSFLDGASLPEDLVEQAAALELPAVALIDAQGVYGAPRFYQAARQAGIKALVGAEIAMEPSRGS